MNVVFALTPALAVSLFTAFGGDLAAQDVSPMFTERAQRREAYRNHKAQAAVHAGIGWLINHQDEKGFWRGPETQVRATCFALLFFGRSTRAAITPKDRPPGRHFPSGSRARILSASSGLFHAS